MPYSGLEKDVQKLRRMVNVARHESDHAVAYREAWRPMAHDSDLHLRMGSSFASNTFLTIRIALWREMLAALMRIWDTRDDSINLAWMIGKVQREDVRERLFDENRRKTVDNDSKFITDTNTGRLFQSAQIRREMLEKLRATADKAVALFNEHASGGGEAHFRFLKRMRHEQLAHRQNTQLTGSPPNWTDESIERFFGGTVEIVSLLLSIVEALAYSLTDTAEVYAHHASLFWASARGERTEGHPNFRPNPSCARPAAELS